MSKADGDAKKAKGNEFFKAKDYPNAITWYTQAIEAYPDDHTYFSNRSAAYMGLRDFENAAEDGRSCIRIKKDFIKGYHRLATALQSAGKYQLAKEALVSGLAVDPRNKDLLDMRSGVEEQIRLERSRDLMAAAQQKEKEGDITGASKCLDEARKIDSKNARLQSEYDRVHALFERAEKQRKASLSGPARIKESADEKYKGGMFEEAIALYSQCISQADTDELRMKALNNRSACYKQLSNFEATIEDTTAVLEIDPENIKAYIRRAQAFEAVERYKLALQDVKYVISLGIAVAGQSNFQLCSQMQNRLQRVITQMKNM